MTIYPDTNIWNALCDQSVDPVRFGAGLAARNTKLVLSFQTIYELLKTLRGSGDEAQRRGKCLFSCLHEHLAGDHIIGVHEILELLGFEMAVAFQGMPAPNSFIAKPGLTEMISEVRRLADGDFSVQADAFVSRGFGFLLPRGWLRKSTRISRPDMKEKLKAISADELREWLTDSTDRATPTALSLLSEKIRYRFREATPFDSMLSARDVLDSPTLRAGKALVRADLYFNWRCAHRGSNPKDLYDDMYHVLGAIYCDAYVTSEPGQAEYAHMLLTQNTTVHIYPPEIPIDQWLGSLLVRQPLMAA